MLKRENTLLCYTLIVSKQGSSKPRLLVWPLTFDDKVLFFESFTETRACNGLKVNFFEEQNALEIMLGCFLAPFFACAGEVRLELCSEGALLTQCSNMLLYRDRTCCSRFATSSSSNSISESNSFV